jgi:hypothetical protein
VEPEVAMGAVEAALAATQFLASMAAAAAAAVGGRMAATATQTVALYRLGLLALAPLMTVAFPTRLQITAQFTGLHNVYKMDILPNSIRH